MFCGSCGKEIPNGSSFCQFCGTPVMSAAPQAVPQQYAQQAVPQPAYAQQSPMQAASPAPMQTTPMITMEPVSITLASPKNARKESIPIGNGIWYAEITNNQLIFSRKGNTASYMFGALGALATMAACDLKPEYSLDADKIRKLEYGKRLGGKLLNLELESGKLLTIIAKNDAMATIESWWQMNMQVRRG